MYLRECVDARRVRTHHRCDAGVEVGGEKPGSNARIGWRSFDVNQLVGVEAAERGEHDNDNEEGCRDGRSGEVWRRRSS
jgi:hypothetical protein